MRRLILIACALLCLLAAPAASASAGSQVVADCNAHARLTRSYTPAQLRDALATIPPNIQEYTDCYDVIQRALLAQIGQLKGDGGSGGSGGSFLPTPVIVVIALLLAAAAAFATMALRRRSAAAADGPAPGGPAPAGRGGPEDHRDAAERASGS